MFFCLQVDKSITGGGGGGKGGGGGLNNNWVGRGCLQAAV